MAEVLSRKEYDSLMRLEPKDRAQRLTSELASASRRVHRLSVLRAQALEQMRQDGWTLDEIGTELGVTRQQIHRLLRAG